MPDSYSIFDLLRPKEILTYPKSSQVNPKTPKLRSIFDENEITLLYVEFVFYNKLFDEKEWNEKFQFRAYLQHENERIEITIMDVDVNVTPGQNMVSVIDYWGDDTQNIVWTKGDYIWEVWAQDTLLMNKEFTVEAFDAVTKDANPYFEFSSLKLFEGPGALPKHDDRTYLSKFQHDATRFIWVEFEFKNLHPETEWKGEFVFNYYNDIKVLVGTETKVETISSLDKNNLVQVYAGVGNDKNVTWAKDLYSIEVIFMDTLIAAAQFEVADKPNRGHLKVEVPKTEEPAGSKNVKIGKEDNIFDELDKLVGLDDIKQKLHDYYYYAKYLKLRKDKGLSGLEDINLNFVFTGNPGTGKTTIAKLLGKIYKSLGLLPKDSVFEADRSDLIGRYIGETAPQTKEVIEKARGGILFIDEAYSLYRGDEKDFGKEAIEVLVKELSDGSGNLSIIVAGYPKEMKTFIESNPGLKSRFNVWFDFPDYIPDELSDISRLLIKKKSLAITKEADKQLNKIITDSFRKRDKHFGNARFVSSLVEEAQVNLGLRVMQNEHPEKLGAIEISTITKTDVVKIIEKGNGKFAEFEVDQRLLNKSLKQLNSLIGLSKVKAEIKEIIKLVKFYKESNKDVLNSLSLHNVFIGNPGTGKTTVARIIADIYKALGLLERGTLIECSRDSLVAGYVGQTAIKTKEKIEEAFGGVLFIDEAYSLTRENGGNDFGGEAVEVILKSMEDYRGKFSLITAGYTNEMIDFLKSNPGLKSRFDNVIEFDDFTSNELMEVGLKMLNDYEIGIEDLAAQKLMEYFEYNYERKDRFFGNARFVRKVIDEAIKNMHVRLSEIPQEERTDEMLHKLLVSDVEEFTPARNSVLVKKKQIGF